VHTLADLKHQVGLIQAEHQDIVRRLLERDDLPAESLRRNLVIERINLTALKDRSFRIGTALLELGYSNRIGYE
jgi:MOSC domain-containing protein YiiM